MIDRGEGVRRATRETAAVSAPRDIRKRVYSSILDFSILLEELGDDEWREIFGEITDGGRQWQNADEDLRSDEPPSAGSLYLLMESGAVDTDVVRECLRDQLIENDSEAG